MDDKKRLIVLLSILGLAFVGGGIWLYMNFKSDENINIATETSTLSRVKVLKNIVNENINYLNSSTSLLNSFYTNDRYLQLQDNTVELEIFGTGNPEPFAPLYYSTSTEEEEEGEEL